MRNNKRLVFLLAATPVLLITMIGIGFIIHSDIVRTSKILYRHANSRKFMEKTVMQLVNAETGQRGFLLTGNEVYLEPYYGALEFMKIYQTEIQTQYNNPSIPGKALNKLDSLTAIKLKIMTITIQLNRQGRREEALGIVNTNQGKNVMDTIRGLVANINRDLDKELIAAENNLRHKVIYLLLLMIVAFITSALLSISGYRAIVSERNKRELMLEEIEEQNSQLKEYTYQSYHQLKTPLRSISGFLQLLQKKFDRKMDDEAAELINFSVQASKDMNMLIEDLRRHYLE
jgi:CHASE3 domain sensor protein